MQRRLSYAEKGKGLAEPNQPPRTGRVRIPAIDTAELIRKHSLTLVGRITNPKFQRLWSLIPFFSEHWKVETKPVGADLGQGCFQFQFASESDFKKVLDDCPYHFARWMFILQCWEPTTSLSFPNQITFWIQVQGIPLHLWSEVALKILAEDIGILDKVEITSTRARMKVIVDGLKPIIKKALMDFDTGESVEVTLVYEKLENHCLLCCMLDHETQECPLGKEKNNRNQADTNKPEAPVRNLNGNHRSGDPYESRSRSRPASRSNNRSHSFNSPDSRHMSADRNPIRSISRRLEENRARPPQRDTLKPDLLLPAPNTRTTTNPTS